MNKSVKKYLRRVRGWLPCTRRMKNDIMARVEESLLSWSQDNPNCTYPDIEARFGKPEKIAAVYVENVGAEELLHNLHEIAQMNDSHRFDRSPAFCVSSGERKEE